MTLAPACPKRHARRGRGPVPKNEPREQLFRPRYRTPTKETALGLVAGRHCRRLSATKVSTSHPGPRVCRWRPSSTRHLRCGRPFGRNSLEAGAHADLHRLVGRKNGPRRIIHRGPGPRCPQRKRLRFGQRYSTHVRTEDGPSRGFAEKISSDAVGPMPNVQQRTLLARVEGPEGLANGNGLHPYRGAGGRAIRPRLAHQGAGLGHAQVIGPAPARASVWKKCIASGYWGGGAKQEGRHEN